MNTTQSSTMPEVGTKRTNYEYPTDETDVQKKSRHDGDKLRLLVLGRYAGTMIGKAGENFIRLREKYNVKITGLSSRANERVLQLDGPRAECLGIVKELLPLCSVGRYPAGNSKWPYEVNLLANTDAVGLLIGKGGTRIREISEQTGVRMKVYPECLPASNERVIALGGEDVDVMVQGMETVLGHIDAAPNRSKTIFFHPDKLNGKQLDSDLLGKTGPAAGSTGAVQMEMIAPIVRDNTNIAAILVAQRNLKEQSGIDTSFDFGSVKTVTTLTLSTDMCGYIIGKGGNNIRYIKQVSGATIDSTKDDGGERTITINGTQDQVQVAEQLMAQCVKASKQNGQQQQLQQQQQQQQSFQQQQQQQLPALVGQMVQQSGFDPHARNTPMMQPWD